MPSPSTSTFMSPRSSRSSLSHWMTVRSGIAAFSIGTSSWIGRSAMTKPPTCCDRWRGKPSSDSASLIQRHTFGLLGSSPASLIRCVVDDAVLPPLQRACERADLELLDAERLADVADGAAPAIGDDRGRQRGPLARVLAIDVLNDLLAPLVLEIDVDVRRLVALLRDETLDQGLHALGIDLGNTQAEADDGIGGRAAALAQDADAAGMAHDVVDRQEIRFVTQLGDQRELVLDQRANFGRLAFRPTPPAAALRQRAQIARRRLSGRNELVRILVAELRQRKIHALEYRERLAQQLGRIEPNELVDGPQCSARRSHAARSRARRAGPCAEWRSACPAACGARGSACGRCRSRPTAPRARAQWLEPLAAAGGRCPSVSSPRPSRGGLRTVP